MKTSLLFLCVFALMGVLLVSPASAGSTLCSGAGHVYCNGAVSGSADAWTMNFGFLVSNSFSVSGSSNLTGLDFGVWLYPGDTLTGVDWAISSGPLATGFIYGSGTAAVGLPLAISDECNGGSCDFGANGSGYDVQSLEFSFGLGGVNIASIGTYWITLQNAVATNGDPVYWDENGGPSLAQESAVGSIASESFAIDGTLGNGVPEPGTLVLLGGSGLLLLAGALRRKLLNR